MAKLVSKSGTKALHGTISVSSWEKMKKLSMMAVLYAKIVETSASKARGTPQTCWHTSEQTTPQSLV